MKFGSPFSVLFLSAVLLAACAAKTDDPTPAIEAGNKRFVENFLKGDEKGLAALYTADAKIIPPGGTIVSGRAEIAKFWRAFMDTGVKDVSLKTLEAKASGNFAYEDGVATIIGKDGSPTAVRYLVVWKRVDERWYLHRDIWNTGQ